jgi:hypothetical protein
MRFAAVTFRSLVAALLCCGCSSSSSSGGQNAPPSLTLESSPLSVAAGQEDYRCWSYTVPTGSPLNVVQTVPTIPKGVHHYAVFTSPDPLPKAPLNYDCHEMGLDWGLVNAGGVGTPGMTFPDGAALALKPGSQIILQLHVLNASADTLDVPSVSVQLLGGEAASYEPIGLLIAGTLNITIPPNDNATKITGGCQVAQTLPNVFAVFPHMHQLGSHIQVGITPSGASSENVIYDAGWSFGTQGVYPVKTSVKTGDQVNVVCTYDNTTDKTVSFGLSSTDEMCFGVLYYYPATTQSSYCGFGAGNGP